MWQRQFSPAIYQTLDSMRHEAIGAAVLGAEINWDGDRPRLFRSTVNYSLLAATGRPVGIVLRIGPYVGTFASDDKAARYIADLGHALVKAAKTGGLEPTELQLDFDCASSKLSGYRLWLEAVRIAVAPTKITFTALPDWLGRADFPVLARSADGYVLQVHSVKKPSGPSEVFKLCDPDQAWAWIERAAQIGAPFRVALPTYGYRLAFDKRGTFIALSAEATPAAWPEGAQVRTVRANAPEVAALAQKLIRAELQDCTGIIWFRLPVPGDQLNWNLTTLKVVLAGNLPSSQLDTEVNWTTPGLAEVSVVNRGEQDEALPLTVTTRWTAAEHLQAADTLGGYIFATDPLRQGFATLVVARATIAERIAPGRSRKIGWLRFSHEIPLIAQIVAAP